MIRRPGGQESEMSQAQGLNICDWLWGNRRYDRENSDEQNFVETGSDHWLCECTVLIFRTGSAKWGSVIVRAIEDTQRSLDKSGRLWWQWSKRVLFDILFMIGNIAFLPVWQRPWMILLPVRSGEKQLFYLALTTPGQSYKGHIGVIRSIRIEEIFIQEIWAIPCDSLLHINGVRVYALLIRGRRLGTTRSIKVDWYIISGSKEQNWTFLQLHEDKIVSVWRTNHSMCMGMFI